MSLGLYRDVLDEEAAYLLSYGEAKVVFAEDEEQVDKLLTLADPRAKPQAHRLFPIRAACGNTTTPRLMHARQASRHGPRPVLRARASAL